MNHLAEVHEIRLESRTRQDAISSTASQPADSVPRDFSFFHIDADHTNLCEHPATEARFLVDACTTSRGKVERDDRHTEHQRRLHFLWDTLL